MGDNSVNQSGHVHSAARRRPSLPAVSLAALLAATPAFAQQVMDQEEEEAPVEVPKVSVTDTVRQPVSATTEGIKNYAAKAATVAGKVPVELKDIPNSVSVITRQQMNDQNMTDLEDVLTWAPGVTVRPNDTAQGWYQSRGYALSTMYDGMPAYDALSGFQQFDIAMYDRVEVLRGPTGLLQGSSDPAGSVNMVRKRPTDTVQASATASIGSWNNRRSTMDVSTPISADRTLKGRFVAVYNDRDFFSDDTHSEKWLGYGILEYTPTPDWTFSYSSTYQQDHNGYFFGVPTYSTGEPINLDRTTNLNTPWTYLDWTTHEEKVDAERRFSNGWTAKVAASWREQSYEYLAGYSGSVNRATNTSNYTIRDGGAQYYRKAVDAYVSGPFRLFNREHSLLLGTNLDMFNSEWARGSATVNGVALFNAGSVGVQHPVRSSGTETRMTQFGQYGQLRFRVLDPLTVIVGGRNSSFDSDSRSLTGVNRYGGWSQQGKVKNELTPYAGTVLEITPQTSLYGSYSEIFVPQTEQTSSGSVLPPRTGWQAEVGVKNTLLNGNLNISATAFLLRDTNRAISDPADDNYYIAAGEVESKGLEAEISGNPVEDLKLTGGYTYLISQYLQDSAGSGGSTGNTYSTWEPRHNLKLWGIYSFADGPLEGFSLGSGVIAKSQTWNRAGNQLHQKAYAVFNAQVGYKINDNLDATLSVDNIFDTEYWATMRSTTNNLYGEPRSVILTLKASL